MTRGHTAARSSISANQPEAVTRPAMERRLRAGTSPRDPLGVQRRSMTPNGRSVVRGWKGQVWERQHQCRCRRDRWRQHDDRAFDSPQAGIPRADRRRHHQTETTVAEVFQGLYHRPRIREQLETFNLRRYHGTVKAERDEVTRPRSADKRISLGPVLANRNAPSWATTPAQRLTFDLVSKTSEPQTHLLPAAATARCAASTVLRPPQSPPPTSGRP